MVAVAYDDLLLAFEFVSSAPPMESSAYVSRDTGDIYWKSEFEAIDNEVPDDLESSDRYIAVPHKNDLDLGRSLALRFAAQVLPEHRERVRGFFERKGAYSRFKQLLEATEALEKWYTFEEAAVNAALREWCSENGIELRPSGAEPAA